LSQGKKETKQFERNCSRRDVCQGRIGTAARRTSERGPIYRILPLCTHEHRSHTIHRSNASLARVHRPMRTSVRTVNDACQYARNAPTHMKNAALDFFVILYETRRKHRTATSSNEITAKIYCLTGYRDLQYP
jgi:hypothetical protein